MAAQPHIEVHQATGTESVTARILITDDRPEVMEMVTEGLGERYACEFASSLEQAREKLEAGSFDLAICDLQTSREAGLAQVEEIAHVHPETAIVLITDVDDPEVTERTFQLGAHGYLVKPFWPGQLLITVKNALRQRHLERALKAESGAIEGHLHLLSDTAPVPIYIKDTERRYVFANRVAHEISGMGPGAMIGLTDKEIASPHQERLAAESDHEVLAGGTFEKVERIRVGGQMRTFLSLKFPFVDEMRAAGGDHRDLDRHHRQAPGRGAARRAQRGGGERGRVAAPLAPGNRRAPLAGDRDARPRNRPPRRPDGDDRVLPRRQARARPRPRRSVARRGADARRRQDRHPGRDPAQARSADRGGALGDGAPHDLRLPDPRRLQERAAADGGDDRARPSRALGRRRLSARAGRRADSDRGQDRRRRRRLRRAPLRSQLPAGDVGRGDGGADAGQAGAPNSTRGSSTSCSRTSRKSSGSATEPSWKAIRSRSGRP